MASDWSVLQQPLLPSALPTRRVNYWWTTATLTNLSCRVLPSEVTIYRVTWWHSVGGGTAVGIRGHTLNVCDAGGRPSPALVERYVGRAEEKNKQQLWCWTGSVLKANLCRVSNTVSQLFASAKNSATRGVHWRPERPECNRVLGTLETLSFINMVTLSTVIRPLASQLRRRLVSHGRSHRITPVRRCNLTACSSKYVLSQSK